MDEKRYGIGQLSELTGLPRRTIRYYVHEGLVGRPVGGTKSAYYTSRHLAELLDVQRLASKGYKLKRIRAIMEARRKDEAGLPPQEESDIERWLHFTVADGIGLQIREDAAKIATEDLRTFIRKVAEAYTETVQHKGE